MLGKGEKPRDGWVGAAHTWMLRIREEKRRPQPDRGLAGRVTVMLERLLQAGEGWLWIKEESFYGNPVTGHHQLPRAVI